MWFKNLHIYRFLRPWALSPTDLEKHLKKSVFSPCGRMEMESHGWVSPFGRDSEVFVHAVHRCFMITLRKEEKILPASVVRDFVMEKIEDIETQQMRKVRKREKEDIREDVLKELIPRAFTRSTYQYAYIDAAHHWLLIDTANRKKAEEFISVLRQTLGSLPVVPPKVQEYPAQIMTHWLTQEQCPPDFEFADACELVDTSLEGAIVNCKRQDLLSEEIQAHLEAGKLVARLALKWNDRIGFVIDDDLIIRRLQFLDIVQSQAHEVEAETSEQRFDADFAIMTGEVAALVKRLFELFGGEDEQAYKQMR